MADRVNMKRKVARMQPGLCNVGWVWIDPERFIRRGKSAAFRTAVPWTDGGANG